ncbi:MAG: hypothetical protein C0415_03935 [Thermodesulfovibrio sp.]|nr:hypothetical protein [Thermodesulfovibrio sp.]
MIEIDFSFFQFTRYGRRILLDIKDMNERIKRNKKLIFTSEKVKVTDIAVQFNECKIKDK